MSVTSDNPVLLYDGDCGLCQRSVQFILDHDPAGKFRFATLQGEYGRGKLDEAGLGEDYFSSLVLIDGDGVHTHSDGAVRIAKHLPMPWRLAWVGRFVPRLVRDLAYNAVAKVRYQIFGRADACRLPSEAERARFIG